jgi:protein-S-isoprenylcysteine O-methyltransferase Ste14
VSWLVIALQVLFWMPMVFRLATRKTPEISFWAELGASFRKPGLVLYELAMVAIWVGLGIGIRTGEVDNSSPLRISAGVLLHLSATAVFAWAIMVHRSWNIEARLESDHQLCTVGPYQFVRHPIYFAFNILGIGAVAFAPNLWVILGAVLLFAGGDLRARQEEAVLIARFGDEYREYMGRVNRAIPGIY